VPQTVRIGTAETGPDAMSPNGTRGSTRGRAGELRSNGRRAETTLRGRVRPGALTSPRRA
jgi:hypothetical protein